MPRMVATCEFHSEAIDLASELWSSGHYEDVFVVPETSEPSGIHWFEVWVIDKE